MAGLLTRLAAKVAETYGKKIQSFRILNMNISGESMFSPRGPPTAGVFLIKH